MTRVQAIPLLAAIAGAAVLVHGYHLGTDDAEEYIPAIKKVADPQLFPVHTEFFARLASYSFFPELIGYTARLTRLPVDGAIFLWHGGSVFLLLLAARQLAGACFQNPRAQWAGVALLACLLTVPVAGTALVIMDPYVTPRSLSTPATLFAIAGFVRNKKGPAAMWLLAAALMHPLMGAYAAAFLGCVWLTASSPGLVAPLAIPWFFPLEAARGVYAQVLSTRTYYWVSKWAWYEWMGVIAPLALLGLFSRIASPGLLTPFRRISRALVLFGVIFTAAGIALSTSDRLNYALRLQPMRSFHLIYVVFYLLLGGLLGEYLLKDSAWRWCLLFLPVAAAMWIVQAQAYPSSPHVEWPGASYRGGWPSAFLWIRDHTPKDAVFALDPNYMALPGDDQHGFRAVAERSALADNLKDSGPVTLFPELADEWKRQVLAQEGWRDFKREDFRKLSAGYGAGWVVLERGQSVEGLVCPYQNDAVSVCRLD